MKEYEGQIHIRNARILFLSYKTHAAGETLKGGTSGAGKAPPKARTAPTSGG